MLEPGTLVMCEFQDEVIVGVVLNAIDNQLWCIWEDGEIDRIDIREVDVI